LEKRLLLPPLLLKGGQSLLSPLGLIFLTGRKEERKRNPFIARKGSDTKGGWHKKEKRSTGGSFSLPLLFKIFPLNLPPLSDDASFLLSFFPSSSHS